MHPYLSEADQDRIVGIVRESLAPRAAPPRARSA
jgi:hypothetical protein